MCAGMERFTKSAPFSAEGRIIIASDRFADGSSLFAAARDAPVCEIARFERIPLADFWRRPDLDRDVFVLVSTHRAPDAISLSRWARLARSIALVFVVPREHIFAWETIGASRGIGIVAREDLGPAVLETAIRAVARARESERALIEILSGRNGVLSELRAVAQDLTLAERELTSRFAGAPTGGAAALAAEAIAALAEAEARMASALAAIDTERPSDLVALVDALVRRDGRPLDRGIGALTSEGPLWLAAPARETRALLVELLARWREERCVGDRLELIVWDAGENARIAAVISRAPNAPRARLAASVRGLISALQPFASACGATIESVGEPRGRVERISFAIQLPKRGVGPGLGRGRAVREPSLEGALPDRRRPT
jgi:hypothetical protein